MVKSFENSQKQKWLKGKQLVQFECLRHPNPSVSFSSGIGKSPLSYY